MGYTIRRLSSILVVAGAIVGTVTVFVFKRFGMPVPVALAMGFLLFAEAATLATTSVVARGTRAKRTSRLPGGWLRGWGEASQMGLRPPNKSSDARPARGSEAVGPTPAFTAHSQMFPPS
jgi:hypothetical protein